MRSPHNDHILDFSVFHIPRAYRPVIHRCIQHMTQNIAEELDLDELAEVTGMSKYHLSRVFYRYIGMTPVRWLWVFRVVLAREFLQNTRQFTVTDIAFACGFHSSAHFTRLFRRVHKKMPTEVRPTKDERCALLGFDAVYGSHPRLLRETMKLMADLVEQNPGLFSRGVKNKIPTAGKLTEVERGRCSP